MPRKQALLTDSVISAFLLCRYKGHLKINGTIGMASDFDRHVAHRDAIYRRRVYSDLLARMPETNVLKSPSINFRTLRQGKLLILDARMTVSDLAASIDAVRRVDGPSLLGDFFYQPIKFSRHDKPGKLERFLLAFHSLVIGEWQGHTPTHGSFIFGLNLQHQTVKLQALQSRVRRLLTDLRALADSPPPLILNQHCPSCEFRARCRQEAESADNLSLLGGMTEREIAKHNRNGIFTVNQLSYTFRYRRPSKRAKRPAKPHHSSLQALALRTQKVHVHGIPIVPEADSSIYFDIEGLPDCDFHYLIGMLRVRGDTAECRSFWAD